VSDISPQRAAPTRRDQFIRGARVLVGICVLAALLYYVDLRQFASTLMSVNPWLFGLMLLTAMVSRFLRAWKWNSLLRARDIHISIWQAVRLSLIAHFTGSWTPGQIGGDAYRVYALRGFGKTGVIVSTLLIERYAGLCAVSFFALISMPITVPFLYRRSPWVLAIVCVAIVLVAGVIPCLFNRRIFRWAGRVVPGLRESPLAATVSRFYETLLAYRNHEGTLVVFALASLAEVFSYFILNWLSARALGLDADLMFFLLAMPIVHLLLRIPISFQAMGIQEGCFIYAMVAHGFTPAEGLAVSILQRALEWIISIVPGGLLLLLTSGPEPELPPPDPTNDTEPLPGNGERLIA